MSPWERIADLPLRVDSLAIEGHGLEVASGFQRRTSVIRLSGGGEQGIGEDVTWDTGDQAALGEAAGGLNVAGEFTLARFSEQLDGIDLFPTRPPQDASYRHYRRWAFESAGLDLALRQAGTSLARVLELQPQPVRFCLSMGLGSPPSTRRVRELLDRDPQVRFKLDASSRWTDALVQELAELGVVDVVDLKGAYRNTPVDQPADPELYRRVAEGLPDALIEDPALTDETGPILEPHRERVTWDAVIHGVDDIEALPYAPRVINFKPSRFGPLRSLLDAYDYCNDRGIAAYGGGQFELACGRGQIQLLASLFHPQAANDVAPLAYHVHPPASDAPRTPLLATPDPRGFRWAGDA